MPIVATIKMTQAPSEAADDDELDQRTEGERGDDRNEEPRTRTPSATG